MDEFYYELYCWIRSFVANMPMSVILYLNQILLKMIVTVLFLQKLILSYVKWTKTECTAE
jgi:hypothetical protein